MKNKFLGRNHEEKTKDSAKKNPPPRAKHKVVITAGALSVEFLFTNKKDAEEFFCAALESISCEGAAIFEGDKCLGGRDGKGS